MRIRNTCHFLLWKLYKCGIKNRSWNTKMVTAQGATYTIPIARETTALFCSRQRQAPGGKLRNSRKEFVIQTFDHQTCSWAQSLQRNRVKLHIFFSRGCFKSFTSCTCVWKTRCWMPQTDWGHGCSATANLAWRMHGGWIHLAVCCTRHVFWHAIPRSRHMISW